jgi:hypothetical protein
MYNITLNPTMGVITNALSPSSGKFLRVRYVTFNADTDMLDPVELYLGATKIFNTLCVRAGVMYGFNLGNAHIQGGVGNPLKVLLPVTAKINLNVIYEEE